MQNLHHIHQYQELGLQRSNSTNQLRLSSNK